MERLTKSIMAVAAALALFGLAAGTVSAVTVTDWNGTNDITDTFDVTNDTESLRVTAENVTNDSADVTVYGVENGTETEVDNGTVTTDESPDGSTPTPTPVYTAQYTYDLSQSDYDTYKVVVSGDGADSLSIAKVNVVTGAAGGGGILPGGMLGGLPMIELVAGALVVAVVGAAAVVQRRA